jgi:hypothetical protein
MQLPILKCAIATGLSLILMGCAPPSAPLTTAPPKPAPVATGGDVDMDTQSCAAKELQYLVGQPRTVLQTMRFGGEVRFEEPGQAYTQDFLPTRTRIIIGVNGKIERIMCG